MYKTKLIIILLIFLIILKIFWLKEHYDLIQEKCFTITNPTDCRMSGCEVGKNNTCITPRTGQSNQAPQITPQQNISTLKQIIARQNYNSMISTGNIKPTDFSQFYLSPKNSKSIQSNHTRFSHQQILQGIREIADRHSKSFQR